MATSSGHAALIALFFGVFAPGCSSDPAPTHEADATNTTDTTDTAAAADTGGGDVTVTSGDLTVLTYNVHGLPPGVTNDDTPARLKEIGPRLAGYDVVGLQESFDNKNHEALLAGAKHPHVHRFDAIKQEAGALPRAYGSGLTILSKHAMTATNAAHYSTCFGYADHASDCLASKGWQMSRLNVMGHVIDVYNTHFEAGGGDEDNKARDKQVDELLAAIATHSEGHAVLFVGDMNLRASDPPDKPLLAKIEAALGDACKATKCAQTDRIDRIFWRSGDNVKLSVTKWSDESGAFKDDKGVDLSDHPPILAVIHWQAL